MTEFTTPQPLQALLIDATQPPWLNEKDEAAASWDDASLPDRQSVAAWVRTWSEGDEIARVKEVMVGVDARIEAAFSVEAAAKFRRWAAGVLLDVFGSSDDLADTIMTPQQRPKFRDASPSLTQFERFEHYDDLWEGEDSRADELSEWIEKAATLGDVAIDDAPAVLTRWVVSISIAELVHMRTSAKREKRAEAQKARRTLLDKAAELRTAVGRPPDDDEDDEDEDGEWDDDDATTPPPVVAAAAPVQSPEPVAAKPEETKEPPAKASSTRKPLPKADAARHATHVGEFYENDENDARTRHARGYDPLDKHAQRVEAEVDDAKERRDALYFLLRLCFFFPCVDTCPPSSRRLRGDCACPPSSLRRRADCTCLPRQRADETRPPSRRRRVDSVPM